jgi:DNA-binding NtrC family response regulator
VPAAEDDGRRELDGLESNTAITVVKPAARERALTPPPLGSFGRLRMLVIGEQTFATPSLPDEGAVTIGRSRTCDVCVDDSLISRHHATIRTGDVITIEDEGSANGTTVRGQRIAAHQQTRVHIGDLITLGHTNFIVQKRASEVRPRRLWTHDYFETRIEDECARAARTGATFGLLRVSVLGDVPATIVEEALAELVRQSDIVGTYGPKEYAVLLVETTAPMTDLVARRIESSLSERGAKSRVQLACYPRDGRSAHTLIQKMSALPDVLGPDKAPQGMIVADPVMLSLYRLVERIASSDISVLILGETGVGKEVFAGAVHRSSPRASGPFVQLNCAALSETLLESELFGHEKGAFTGAVAAKAGLLESANGGTVLLDEIGDMPMTVQAKLLRVLEERRVRRLGSVKPRSIDVRFLAATNRDLELDEMRFRRDLYFRLNGVTVMIPPLRERISEIEPLARSIATRAAAQNSRPTPEFTPEAIELLCAYSWPGNVRELRNIVERAVLLSDGAPIAREHLPAEKMRGTIVATVSRGPARGTQERRSGSHPVATPPPDLAPGPAPTPPPEPPSLDPSPPAAPPRYAGKGPDEMQRILAALERARGNQTKAAELLGISRRTLINRLDEYGFARPRKKRNESDSDPEA